MILWLFNTQDSGNSERSFAGLLMKLEKTYKNLGIQYHYDSHLELIDTLRFIIELQDHHSLI
jgi:hypothetical protein